MTTWSKTAPKKAGWYWVRVDTFGLQVARYDERGAWFGCGWMQADSNHVEIGPRVPTPEAIEMAREALHGLLEKTRGWDCSCGDAPTHTHWCRLSLIDKARAALEAIGGGK